MYSITGMIVDGNGKVVSLNWCYENADGKLSNTHQLHTPEGDVPIAQVTEDIAIGWLTGQLPNTAEEFDAAIANAKQPAEYQATLVPYTLNEQGTFSPPAEEPVDPNFGVTPPTLPIASPY